MAQDEAPNPRNYPLMASISLGELEDAIARSLSDVLYDEGLDQLPSIAMSLASIAQSLETIAQNTQPAPIVHMISGQDAENIERLRAAMFPVEEQS